MKKMLFVASFLLGGTFFASANNFEVQQSDPFLKFPNSCEFEYELQVWRELSGGRLQLVHSESGKATQRKINDRMKALTMKYPRPVYDVFDAKGMREVGVSICDFLNYYDFDLEEPLEPIGVIKVR